MVRATNWGVDIERKKATPTASIGCEFRGGGGGWGGSWSGAVPPGQLRRKRAHSARVKASQGQAISILTGALPRSSTVLLTGHSESWSGGTAKGKQFRAASPRLALRGTRHVENVTAMS